MDYQKIIEKIEAFAGIYSFEKLPDGTNGEIRLEAVNKMFEGVLTRNPQAPKFYPGIPYKYYFKEVNFEDFCYRCALTKQPMHSYVNAFGGWINGIYIPIESDKENTYYCCYILSFTHEPDSESMSERNNDVSKAVLDTCIKLHSSANFVDSIKNTIRDISKICDAEKCSVLLVDKNEKKCELLTEEGLCNENSDFLAISMNRSSYEVAESFEKILAGSDCLILKNDNDMNILKQRDPIWYNSLKSFSVNSIVMYSLKFNEEIVGFIWAINFNTENALKIKETLELTSFFIGSAVANHQLLKRLEVMSMVDMLTGVKNRNAMNRRVDKFIDDKINPAQTLGVAFADLNGLKILNDSQGHTAGDILLKKAAALLTSVFYDSEIYRAGGDEFMILCFGISNDELERRVEKLKSISESSGNVSFAVGCAFETGDIDIHRAMILADEEMYNDKQQYYKKFPERRRQHSL